MWRFVFRLINLTLQRYGKNYNEQIKNKKNYKKIAKTLKLHQNNGLLT